MKLAMELKPNGDRDGLRAAGNQRDRGDAEDSREVAGRGDSDAEHAFGRHVDSAGAGRRRARIHFEERDGSGFDQGGERRGAKERRCSIRNW